MLESALAPEKGGTHAVGRTGGSIDPAGAKK